MKPQYLLVALLAAAAFYGSSAQQYKTVKEFLKTRNDMKLLLKAANQVGLTPYLDTPNITITLFAPVDNAWRRAAKLAGVSVQQLMANSTYLAYVLAYHSYSDAVIFSNDIPPNITLTMDNDETLYVWKPAVKITLFGDLGKPAVVTKANITAAKSVIHVIDNVLIPDFNTSPTPSPSPPAKPQASPSPTIIDSPPPAVVDSPPPAVVLSPPATPLSSPPPPEGPVLLPIEETLAKEGDCTILLALLKASNLAEEVFAPPAKTILAPNDKAFEAALALAEQLGFKVDINNPGSIPPFLLGVLVDTAKLHILKQALKAEELTDGLKIDTMGARGVVIDRTSVPGSIVVALQDSVSQTTIVKTDIMAAGGFIIHKIDSILSTISLG
mmetsp:Transcript_26484/g.57787  ORF Transcript_26484/g.57787 Transcript_26484/m.57787 type:complete len:384 (+) Transcript_26484:122-1273(+)